MTTISLAKTSVSVRFLNKRQSCQQSKFMRMSIVLAEC